MNQNWHNDPRFLNLPWEKRTFLLNFVQEHKKNDKESLLKALLSLNQILSQKNIVFNEAEKKLLMDIILDAMTPQEKQSFSQVTSMLHGS